MYHGLTRLTTACVKQSVVVNPGNHIAHETTDTLPLLIAVLSTDITYFVRHALAWYEIQDN